MIVANFSISFGKKVLLSRKNLMISFTCKLINRGLEIISNKKVANNSVVIKRTIVAMIVETICKSYLLYLIPRMKEYIMHIPYDNKKHVKNIENINPIIDNGIPTIPDIKSSPPKSIPFKDSLNNSIELPIKVIDITKYTSITGSTINDKKPVFIEVILFIRTFLEKANLFLF